METIDENDNLSCWVGVVYGVAGAECVWGDVGGVEGERVGSGEHRQRGVEPAGVEVVEVHSRLGSELLASEPPAVYN